MKKICCLSYFLFQISYFLFSQNVGIGTTTPTRAKLELHGSVNSTSAIFGGESTGISLQSNWPGIGFNQYHSNGHRYMANGYGAVMYFDPNYGYLALDISGYGTANSITSTKRVLEIANNGNMGIGIAPTNATLYVIKGANPDGAAVFGGTLYNSHFNYGFEEDTYIRGGKNGSKVFINDINGGSIIIGGGNGLVGINNGIPVYPLEIRQVNGRGLALVEPSNSFNNWEYRIQRFGTGDHSDMNLFYNQQAKGFFHYSTGNYTVYSDRRLKTNIGPMQTVLHTFMQLQPVEYEMKYHNANHERTAGFIAQDVRQLFPDMVSIVTDTSRGYPNIPDLHAIRYNGFTVLTIKAIQEQQQLIKTIKQQNAALAKRIERAEAILNAKKQQVK